MRMIATILAITGGFMSGCKAVKFSEQPDMRIQESRQFDTGENSFSNPDREALTMKTSYSEMLREYFRGDQQRVPNQKLPEVSPDLTEFQKPSKNPKVIWLGHSGFLLRIKDTTILVDPVLSDYASPVSFLIGKRFQPPVIKAEDLPPVDIVLISHDHYDHLDKKTILVLKDSQARFVVPLGVGRHLRSWGTDPARIFEADWWEELSIEGIRLVCTPAQHFSGRGLFDRNSTLWASWAILTENSKIFYSGDSGYSPHYKEIGEKLGPFDLAFVENGQYDQRWPGVHQTPEQAVQAVIDLKSQAAIPVHWGMFELAFHAWYEPAERFVREAGVQGIKALTPVLGEVLEIREYLASTQTRWWRNLLAYAGVKMELSPPQPHPADAGSFSAKAYGER